MKRFFSLNVISLCAVTAFLSTSCISDAPGDHFYRTLWTSSDSPLGKITIEFLCGGQISIQSPDAVGSYGTYVSDGHTARFNGLTLMYESESAAALAESDDIVAISGNVKTLQQRILIEEAHRSGDLLTIIWHLEGSSTARTSRLTRLSAYE